MFKDGIRVYTKDGGEEYPDMTALDVFRIPEDNKIDVIRHLMAFGTLDLTGAYGGHTVIFELYKE